MNFAKRYHPKFPSNKSPSEIAQIDFRSCSHPHGCPLPSNDEWYDFGDILLPFLRIGFVVIEQDKSSALKCFKALDLETRSDLIQNLELLSTWFNGNAKLVDAARARLAIVCACIAEQES
jgi:hypothetical protein